MTDKPTTTEELYEEWVAHPNFRAYVHKEDHQNYATRHGWWCHGETTLTNLGERGVTPEPRSAKKATT